MSQTEPWTILRLLEWTTDYLTKQGADTPRLDAEVLLAHARGCQRIQLYTAFDQVADEPLRESFRALVRRRAEGTPVAYLVGYREFFSLRFRVTPDVLIPRPETELLVLELLDLAGKRPASAAGPTVIDVGAGSGVIAICAAKNLPAADVYAVDVSPAALAVAGENAAALEVADRVRLVEADLLTSAELPAKADFVVSNPPYVSEAELAECAPEVRDQEPRLALVGGAEGTEIIARLIPQAAERLHPGGWLLMEVSPMIHRRVMELIASDGRFDPPSVKKDLAHHPRVVMARLAES